MTVIDSTNFAVYYHTETTEGTPEPSVAYSPLSSSAVIKIDDIGTPVVIGKSASKKTLAGKPGAHYVKVTITGNIGNDLETFYKTYYDSDSALTIIATEGANYYVISGCKIGKLTAIYKTKQSSGGNTTALTYELIICGWKQSTTKPTGATFGTPSGVFEDPDTAISITVGGSTLTGWTDFEFAIGTKLLFDYDNSANVTACVRGTINYSGWINYISPGTNTEASNTESASSTNVVITMSALTLTFASATYQDTTEKIPDEDIINRKVNWVSGGALAAS